MELKSLYMKTSDIQGLSFQDIGISILPQFLQNPLGVWDWMSVSPFWELKKKKGQSKYCTKQVTLVYLYHVNRWDTHKKLSIAKLDFVQVCELSLNFYNNTLRKFYKFSDSQQTWTSPTLQSADWPISRQYHRPQMRKRVSYPEV